MDLLRIRQPIKEDPAIPTLLKILIVFGLVLTLNRCRLQLSLSLFVGSLVLGLWLGMAPLEWLQVAFQSMIRFQTLSLLLIVGLIVVLSRIMEHAGQMRRLVQSFTRLARDSRIIGSVMTAMIGLLPMPGGALFSAPLVESSLAGKNVSPEQKTLLNYWFRHVWEYWWPLYPGVVLALALLNVETWRYILFMAPLTGISIAAGVIFILRPMGKIEINAKGGFSTLAFKGFLWEMMPILIVIGLVALTAGLTAAVRYWGLELNVSGAVSILPGLLAAIGWVWAVNRIPAAKIRSAFFDRKALPMLFLVLAIMVFQGTLTESQAVVHISDELAIHNVPLLLVIILMPLLSGFVTGIAVGFVGLAFPLIIPMFPASPFLEYMAYTALAFTFGYMGMMLSPVHLCFLVTKDYYRASLLKCYPRLLLCALTVIGAILTLFLGLIIF